MNKEFTIGSHSVGNNAPVFIVAEMSANHLQDYGGRWKSSMPPKKPAPMP